jgi:hypothetical protein
MKSVSIAMAVLALAYLIDGGTTDLPRIPLLAASLVAVILTYVATTVGSNLLPDRLHVMDAVFPIGLTVLEAVPLVLLSSSTDTRSVADGWIVSTMFFNLAVVALLYWVGRRMSEERYEPTLWDEVVEPYLERIRGDRKAAATAAALLLLILIATHAGSHRPDAWVTTLAAGGATAFIFTIGLVRQEGSARLIRDTVERKARSEDTSGQATERPHA